MTKENSTLFGIDPQRPGRESLGSHSMAATRPLMRDNSSLPAGYHGGAINRVHRASPPSGCPSAGKKDCNCDSDCWSVPGMGHSCGGSCNCGPTPESAPPPWSILDWGGHQPDRAMGVFQRGRTSSSTPGKGEKSTIPGDLCCIKIKCAPIDDISLIALHCYIKYKPCFTGNSHTMEVWQDIPPRGHNHIWHDRPGAERGVRESGDPSGQVLVLDKCYQCAPITDGTEASPCECLINESANYRFRDTYRVFPGPNSNTYVRRMATYCGLVGHGDDGVYWPFRTPGAFYRDNSGWLFEEPEDVKEIKAKRELAKERRKTPGWKQIPISHGDPNW